MSKTINRFKRIIFFISFVTVSTLGAQDANHKIAEALSKFNSNNLPEVVKKIKDISPDKGIIESIRTLDQSELGKTDNVQKQIKEYQKSIKEVLLRVRREYMQEYVKRYPKKARTLYGTADIGSWVSGDIKAAADFDLSVFGVDKAIADEVVKGCEKRIAIEMGLPESSDLAREADIVFTPEGYEERSGVYGNKASKDWASRTFKNFILITPDGKMTLYKGGDVIAERAHAQRIAEIRKLMSEKRFGNAYEMLFDHRGNFTLENQDKISPEAKKALDKLLGELGMFKAKGETASGGIIEMAAHLNHEVLSNAKEMKATDLLDKINKYASRGETMKHLGGLPESAINSDVVLGKHGDPALREAYEFMMKYKGLRKKDLLSKYGENPDKAEIMRLGSNVEKVLKRLAIIQFQHQIDKALLIENKALRESKILEIKSSFDAELPKELYHEFHREIFETLSKAEKLSHTKVKLAWAQEAIRNQQKLIEISRKKAASVKKLNRFLNKTYTGRKIKSLLNKVDRVKIKYGLKANDIPIMEMANMINEEPILERSQDKSVGAGGKVVHYLGTAALLIGAVEAIQNAQTDAEMAMALGHVWASSTLYGLIASETYIGVSEGDPERLAKAIMFMLVPEASIPDLVKALGLFASASTQKLFFDDQMNAFYVLSNYYGKGKKKEVCSQELVIDGYKADALVKDLYLEGSHTIIAKMHEDALQKTKGENEISFAKSFVVERSLKHLKYDGQAAVFPSYAPLVQAAGTIKNINEQIEIVAKLENIEIPKDQDHSWLDDAHGISRGLKQAIRKLMITREKEWEKIEILLAKAIESSFREKCYAEVEIDKGAENAQKLLKEVLDDFEKLSVREPCQKSLETMGKFNRIKYLFSSDREVQMKAMKSVLKYKSTYSYILTISELIKAKIKAEAGVYPVPVPLNGWPALICKPSVDIANTNAFQHNIMVSINEIASKMNSIKFVKTEKEKMHFDKTCGEDILRALVINKYRQEHYALLLKNYKWMQSGELSRYKVLDSITIYNELNKLYEKKNILYDLFGTKLDEYKKRCFTVEEKGENPDTDRTIKDDNRTLDPDVITEEKGTKTRESIKDISKDDDGATVPPEVGTKAEKDREEQESKGNVDKPEESTSEGKDKKDMTLQVTAPSNWKGGNTDSGASFKRDTARLDRVTIEGSLVIDTGRDASVHGSKEELLKNLKERAQKSREIRNIKTLECENKSVVRTISIDGYSGYLLESLPHYCKGIWSRTTKALSVSSAEASGWIFNNGHAIHIGYSIHGAGRFKDKYKSFVVSQVNAARSEAMNILSSLHIGQSGGFTKIPYTGPKLDGSDRLKVMLTATPDKPAFLGDMVEVIAKASGGKAPYTYTWTGDHGGKGDSVLFASKKEGEHKLSVTITDMRGDTTTAEITIKVEALDVTIRQTSPAVNTLIFPGTEVSFEAKIKGGDGHKLEYLWQPHPEVTFNPFENKLNTKAIFPTIGTYKVWIEVYSKEGKIRKTVGESKQLEIQVVKPKIKLTADKVKYYVGEKVGIRVQEEPKIKDDLITFWWEVKGGDVLNSGPEVNIPNQRVYSFIPKSKEKTIVTVHAKAKHSGEDLGEASITIEAGAYQVKLSQPKRLDKAPWKWDPKQGKAVELPQAIAVFQNAEVHATIMPKPKAKIRYQWTVSPAGCIISAPGSKSTNLNAHEAKTYAVKVKISDQNGIVLGRGNTSFAVTVSRKDLATVKQKGKDHKKAKELLKKAQELWQEGELKQAITKTRQAKILLPKDKRIVKTYKNRYKQKKRIDSLLSRAKRAIKSKRLKEAQKRIEDAATISDKYPDYQKVLKKLKEAQAKINKEQEEKELAELSIKKAKLLWKQGKLDKAIEGLKMVARKFPKNKKLLAALHKMQRQKSQEDSLIIEAEQRIIQGSLSTADLLLSRAANISTKYRKYLNALKLLKMTTEKEKRKEKEEEKAKKLLEKSLELWGKGKLDKAVALIPEIKKSLRDNNRAMKKAQKMKRQKALIDKYLAKASSAIKNKKFIEANESLDTASNISELYPKYTDLLRTLKEEKKKFQTGIAAKIQRIAAKQRAEEKAAKRKEEIAAKIQKIATEQKRAEVTDTIRRIAAENRKREKIEAEQRVKKNAAEREAKIADRIQQIAVEQKQAERILQTLEEQKQVTMVAIRQDTGIKSQLPVVEDFDSPHSIPKKVLHGLAQKVAGSLQGLSWEMPCNEVNRVCSAKIPKPIKSTVLGGDSDIVYKVKLRFRGVVEQESYTEGVQDGAWYAGGKPNGGSYNIYKLEISDPHQIYFLNAGKSGIQHCWHIDYTRTIMMRGGAEIILSADAQDGSLIGNIDKNNNPIIINGVYGINQPYNGQFIQMDVLSVEGESKVLKQNMSNNQNSNTSTHLNGTYGNETRSFGGYWKLIEEKGNIGKGFTNSYYKDVISGFGSHIITTDMIRKNNHIYCKLEGEWGHPPDKLYPGRTIEIPVTINRLIDTGEYSCFMKIYFDLWNMECGFTGGRGRDIGEVRLNHKSSKSIQKLITWRVKKSHEKGVNEIMTIRACVGARAQILGKDRGMKYYYKWIPKY